MKFYEMGNGNLIAEAGSKINMLYDTFTYLYPPRPTAKISLRTLSQYDNGQYLGSPKCDGSNGVLFLPGDNTYTLYNRHNEKMTLYNPKIPFASLHRGKGWMVLSGEVLNKNKKGIDGLPFNNKFVIFDILVFNNQHLCGWTFEDRAALLERLYPCLPCVKDIKENGMQIDEYLCETEYEDIYKVANFMGNFEKLYRDLIKIDMYEGLVLKRRNAKLEACYSEGNNKSWALKCRKPAANYIF